MIAFLQHDFRSGSLATDTDRPRVRALWVHAIPDSLGDRRHCQSLQPRKSILLQPTLRHLMEIKLVSAPHSRTVTETLSRARNDTIQAALTGAGIRNC